MRRPGSGTRPGIPRAVACLQPVCSRRMLANHRAGPVSSRPRGGPAGSPRRHHPGPRPARSHCGGSSGPWEFCGRDAEPWGDHVMKFPQENSPVEIGAACPQERLRTLAVPPIAATTPLPPRLLKLKNASGTSRTSTRSHSLQTSAARRDVVPHTHLQGPHGRRFQKAGRRWRGSRPGELPDVL